MGDSEVAADIECPGWQLPTWVLILATLLVYSQRWKISHSGGAGGISTNGTAMAPYRLRDE